MAATTPTMIPAAPSAPPAPVHIVYPDAMVAFWCGSGFGVIAGAAAYAAKANH